MQYPYVSETYLTQGTVIGATRVKHPEYTGQAEVVIEQFKTEDEWINYTTKFKSPVLFSTLYNRYTMSGSRRYLIEVTVDTYKQWSGLSALVTDFGFGLTYTDSLCVVHAHGTVKTQSEFERELMLLGVQFDQAAERVFVAGDDPPSRAPRTPPAFLRRYSRQRAIAAALVTAVGATFLLHMMF